jgi:type I restriction enzyme S subunit
MSNETKNKTIPQLRFPEFKDAEEWGTFSIGDYIESYRGGAPLTPADFVPYSDYEVIPKKAINEGSWLKMDKENPTYCTEHFYFDNQESVVDSTYLITTLRDLVPSGPNIGYIVKYIGNKKYILAQGVYGLKPKETIIPDFLIHFSNTIRYRKLVNSIMVGSTQVHIRNGDFLKLPINIPLQNEQQKIADSLSSLDDFISAQSQKLETLKAHKKGLMQQLFPVEGETVPKLRFAEFRDSGEWKETTLGKCLLQHPEYGINAPAVPYSSSLPTYLRITDISEDGVFLKNEKVSVEQEVTEINYLEEGDIALARTGASVGKSYKYRIEDGELVFAGFLIRVKPDKNKLNSELLFQYLSTDQYWHWVHFSSARSGQPGINGNEYASMPIILPPSLEEQKKIADCLSSLDELITAQVEKIDALKGHKKGLMQGLFPNVKNIDQ